MAGVARSVMEWRVGWLRRVECTLWLRPLSKASPAKLWPIRTLSGPCCFCFCFCLHAAVASCLHTPGWLTLLAVVISEACNRRRKLLAVGAGLWPACTCPWPPGAILTGPHLPAGGAPAHAGTRAAAGDDTVSRARLLQARPCLLPPAPHLALLPYLPSLLWAPLSSVFSV